MPRMTVVRYVTKPECADQNEALSRAVYAELRRTAPAHVSYALFRSGAEFLHLFVNARDDSSDAVTELPAFKAFQKDIPDRCIDPPNAMRINFDLIDAYGLASPAREATLSS